MAKKKRLSENTGETSEKQLNTLEAPKDVSTLEDSIRWAIAYLLSKEPSTEWPTIDIDQNQTSADWSQVDVADFCMEIEEWVQRSNASLNPTLLCDAEMDINNHIAERSEFTGRELLHIIQKYLPDGRLPQENV